MNIFEAARSIPAADIYRNLVDPNYKKGNVSCLSGTHSDNKPSMGFYSKSFKCLSCNWKGSSIDLVMTIKSLPALQAAEYICKEYKIPYDKPKENPERNNYLDSLLAINVIQSYWIKSTAGEQAMLYLKQRGLSDKTISDYQLGYIPRYFGQSSNLSSFKANHKLTDHELEQYNLIHNGMNTFGERITIPISDAGGRIIAFAGRSLAADPKYLLQSTNTYWQKSDYLYGWHYASRNKIINLVEGFFDVLSLYDVGKDNTCALMGTSLSEQHKKLLKNKTIILALDNDKPGHNAMLDIILENPTLNIYVPLWYLPRKHQQKFKTMSELKDANDILQKDRTLLSNYTINNCTTKYEYILKYYRYYKDLSSPYVRKELRDTLKLMLQGTDKTTISEVSVLFKRILRIQEEK
jgi:DNA primase catalytic core